MVPVTVRTHRVWHPRGGTSLAEPRGGVATCHAWLLEGSHRARSRTGCPSICCPCVSVPQSASTWQCQGVTAWVGCLPSHPLLLDHLPVSSHHRRHGVDAMTRCQKTNSLNRDLFEPRGLATPPFCTHLSKRNWLLLEKLNEDG